MAISFWFKVIFKYTEVVGKIKVCFYIKGVLDSAKGKLNKEQTEENYSYSDLFFEKGHWFLKIKQVFIALLGWVCFIVPTFITIASLFVYDFKREVRHCLWRYSEGVLRLNFCWFCLLSVSLSPLLMRRAWQLFKITEENRSLKNGLHLILSLVLSEEKRKEIYGGPLWRRRIPS